MRAERSRQRQVEHEDEAAGLWARMAAETMAGTLSVAVPRRGSRPARSAKLEVRFAPVVLRPPARIKLPPCASGQSTLGKWATGQGERTPRSDASDDGQTESFWGCLRSGWTWGAQLMRWGIEVIIRTLKSGRRIQHLILEDRESLQVVPGP